MDLKRIFMKAGGVSEVAKRFDVTMQAVYRWKNSGRVPAELVLDLAEMADVSVCDIRPDIYPPERFGGK